MYLWILTNAHHLWLSINWKVSHYPLLAKSSLRYLGIYINSYLKWNDHVKFITAKASRTPNHLRYSLYSYLLFIRESCSLYMYSPASTGVWISCMVPDDIKQSETVQHRVARWLCGSHWNSTQKCWSKSSDSCLDQLSHSGLRYMTDRNIVLFANCMHSIFNNYSAIPFFL